MNLKIEQAPEIQALSDGFNLNDSNEDSLTLSIGNECLDQNFNNAEKAIENYPSHTFEIGLASICRKMNEMTLTQEVEELFNHVLNLVQINDQAINV